MFRPDYSSRGSSSEIESDGVSNGTKYFLFLALLGFATAGVGVFGKASKSEDVNAVVTFMGYMLWLLSMIGAGVNAFSK
jgi:hypothetical protein